MRGSRLITEVSYLTGPDDRAQWVSHMPKKVKSILDFENIPVPAKYEDPSPVLQTNK